jgi:hypothetical protein
MNPLPLFVDINYSKEKEDELEQDDAPRKGIAIKLVCRYGFLCDIGVPSYRVKFCSLAVVEIHICTFFVCVSVRESVIV